MVKYKSMVPCEVYKRIDKLNQKCNLKTANFNKYPKKQCFNGVRVSTKK